MRTRWEPRTQDEKLAVQEQLNRMLLDSIFANSERYRNFLRFVVQRALDGEADSIKERILGIEIFGRNPGYDSTSDPIVRVTASKIRKRISMYYENPEHQGELRLSFPAGSYVPIFERSDAGEELDRSRVDSSEELRHSDGSIEGHTNNASAEQTPLETVGGEGRLLQRLGSFSKGGLALVGGAAVITLAVICSLTWRSHHSDAPSGFWKPLFLSQRPVLLCVGDEPRGHLIVMMDPTNPTLPEVAGHPPFVIDVENTQPVANLTSMVASHQRTFSVQGQHQTTLADLSKGPDVLFGAYNNIWTLRLTNSLRFHFGGDVKTRTSWIEDRKAPTDRRWLRDPRMIDTETGRDYALVARFIPPDTGQPTAVVAGLSHNSSVAALGCLLSSECLRQLNQVAPSDWRDRNLEFVLEMRSVDGKTGKPVVVSADTW